MSSGFHPGLIVVPVALGWVFLYFCVGTWRLYEGRERARPLIEDASTGLIFWLVTLVRSVRL